MTGKTSIKARLFTRENISRLSLSPYVEYIVEKNVIIFRNDLFNQVVISPPLKGNPGSFTKRLREGMNEEDLRILIEETFLSCDAGEVLTTLMQKGIIE